MSLKTRIAVTWLFSIITSLALVSEANAMCLQVVVTTYGRRNLGYTVDSRFDERRTVRQSDSEQKTPSCFTNFAPISPFSGTAIFVCKNVKLWKSSTALFLFQCCHNYLLAIIVAYLCLATARQTERDKHLADTNANKELISFKTLKTTVQVCLKMSSLQSELSFKCK